MSLIRRLQAIYETKQKEWEATHARLTSLYTARAIETDPENKFKFDQRIKVVEQEQQTIQDELTQIEQELAQTKPDDFSSYGISSSQEDNQSPTYDDYILLEKFLAENRWSKADEETCRIILKLIGKSDWTDVVLEDINQLPQIYLDQVNQLWNHHSDGKFGFSAQKAVWRSIGGKQNVYEYNLFCQFGELLGWRNLSASKNYEQWSLQKDLDFSLQANKGHLPSVLSPAVTHPAIAHPNIELAKTTASGAAAAGAGLGVALVTGGIGVFAIPLVCGAFALAANAADKNRLKSSGQLLLALLSRF